MSLEIAYRRVGGSWRYHESPDYGARAQRFVTALVRHGFVVDVYHFPEVVPDIPDHADDERRYAQGC